MIQAKRDNNYESVGLAYDGTDTQPLLVDPVTSRLLISCYTIKASPTVHSRLKRDNNHIPVAGGTTDTTSVATPLQIDSDSGFLSIDLLQE